MQQKQEKTTQHANLPLKAYLQKQQTRAHLLDFYISLRGPVTACSSGTNDQIVNQNIVEMQKK